MRARIKAILGKSGSNYLFVDFVMMALLAINLSLILFDFAFSADAINGLFQRFTPRFHKLYDFYIHRNFIAIDLGFVTIFLFELIIRWIIAIKNQKYHRWFFYPFIHWYDVLGCIPLGSFRFLRLLRVIGLTVRLHKFGVIDLTKTYIYQKVIKYLNIFTEEVSDRVVIQVLSGVQKEIKDGTPVLDRIVKDLVLPRKGVLVDWVSYNIQKATSAAYNTHVEDLQDYINQKIVTAIDNNPELKTISKIPIVGSVVTNNLEKTVCDMVDSVVDECFQDLASPGNKEVVEDITHLVLDSFTAEHQDNQLNYLVKDIVVEALQMIKEQVGVQQWKIKEELNKDRETPDIQQEAAEIDRQSY